MTTRYTDQEWATIIAAAEKQVQQQMSANGERKYHIPPINTPEFVPYLAKTIDHTLLKLDATGAQIDELCAQARDRGFKSVCVRPNFVQRAVANLRGSDVVVACVVGFPEGTQDLYQKMDEARTAVAQGAAELDIVINHTLLTNPPTPDSSSTTSTNQKPSSKPTTTTSSSPAPASVSPYSTIYAELATLRTLCPSPTLLKIIFETSQLNPQQITAVCQICAAARVDMVKTSTGFLGRGATIEDVRLMRAMAELCAQPDSAGAGETAGAVDDGRGTGKGMGRARSPQKVRPMGVKASGGVRTLGDAVKMLEAGATRIGTSGGVFILAEAREAFERGEGSGKRPGGMTRMYTDY